MERCKTCRWWDMDGGEEFGAGDVTRFCLCDKILKVSEVNARRREARDVGDILRFEDDEAIAFDGSEYLSTFATGP